MHVAGIIEKYYDPSSPLRRILVRHSRRVAAKALAIAARVPHMNPDLQFLEEAAMLHDIGVFMTSCPEIGCYGPHPYLAHGYLGRELLDKEGHHRHGLACERHVGTGITEKEIRERGLPLPPRDMVPVTPEEKILCFADKFYSKGGGAPERELPFHAVRTMVARYGRDKLRTFDEWAVLFGEDGVG